MSVGTMASAVHIAASSVFPAVVTTNSKVSTSMVTIGATAPPSGTVAGDLLLAFVSWDIANDTMTASAGWTQIQSIINGGVHQLRAFARIADGGANDSFTPSGGGTTQDTCVGVLRISPHAVTNVATDIKAAGQTAGVGGADPPSLDAGSSRKWLWIAAAGVDFTGTSEAITAVPANYTQQIITKSAATTSSSGLGIGSRQLETQTENPGIFTHSPSCPSANHTIAVP